MRRGNEIQKICVTECEALRLGIHLHYLYIVRSMMFTLAWLCTFIYLEGELARLRGLPMARAESGHSSLANRSVRGAAVRVAEGLRDSGCGRNARGRLEAHCPRRRHGGGPCSALFVGSSTAWTRCARQDGEQAVMIVHKFNKPLSCTTFVGEPADICQASCQRKFDAGQDRPSCYPSHLLLLFLFSNLAHSSE